jgi:hypothetical protein
VARERGPNLGSRRTRPLAKERSAAHHHTGRAEAALHGIVLDEGRLHGMQPLSLRQALDGRHTTSADVDGQEHAGAYGCAVEPDRAGRARPTVARSLGAAESKIVSQQLSERGARLDLRIAHRPIDRYRDMRRLRSRGFRHCLTPQEKQEKPEPNAAAASSASGVSAMR